MTTGKKMTLWIASALLASIFGALLVGFWASRPLDISLNDSRTVRINKPSLIQSWSGSTCTMTFTSKGNKTNTVILGQDTFESPVFVLRSAESNTFYCVYDFDTDWQLIRINLTQPFKPPSTNDPLQAVIRPSDCEVDRVSPREVSDWNFAARTVEQMSNSQFHKQSLGWGPTQKRLLKELRSFGEQGQYSGDSVVPQI